MSRRDSLWTHIQQAPLELAIAALAIAASFLSLTTTHPRPLLLALYIILALGGIFTIAGRLRDALDLESAGLALLLAAFLFATFDSLGKVHRAVEVAGVVLNYGALAAGFGIRLYVVRRATAARRRGAQIIHDHLGRHQ